MYLRSCALQTVLMVLFLLVYCFCECTNTNLPVLPRNRRAPQSFEVGTGEGQKDHTALLLKTTVVHCQAYFEVLDLAIASTSD